MELKVTGVVSFSEQTYGQHGNHRAVLKFEGQDKNYSAFMKEAPKIGDTLTGELKTVEKDGKTFHNFEFAKKGVQNNGQIMEMLTNIRNTQVSQGIVLQDILDKVNGKKPMPVSDYPLDDEPAF